MSKLSKTAKFYRENPEAAEKHREYQRKLNKKPEQKTYRAELNAENRKRKSPKGDKKDLSHTSKGIVLKPQSVNRGSKSDTAGDKRARGKKK
jgi:hypothetical protein